MLTSVDFTAPAIFAEVFALLHRTVGIAGGILGGRSRRHLAPRRGRPARSRHRLLGLRGRGGSGSGRRCDGRRGPGGGRRRGSRLVESWRIEEDRVFALQPSGRPRDLDQHVDERLVDRGDAAHLEIGLAAGALLDGEAQKAKDGGILDLRVAIGLGRSDAGRERVELARLEGNKVDLGRQDLPERRTDGELSEAGGLNRERGPDEQR